MTVTENSLAHTLGMQISCGVHPQIQEKGNIRQSEKRFVRTVPRVRHLKGEHGSERACHEGACPHAESIPPKYSVVSRKSSVT